MPTGLARITKDLAVHACSLPEFRVGSLGRGYPGSRKLPFYQACFPESDQWGEQILPTVWQDFAGNQAGVLMSIFDLSRLDWLSRPKMGGDLQDFLTSNAFQKWAYIPVDHYGVGGKLTAMAIDTALGFDRILAYTLFGKQILQDSLGREVDWIPHGINGDVFKPLDSVPGRTMLGVQPDEYLIGCVMTNQARKDWGTAFAVAARLGHTGWKFWFHTDTVVRYWNLFALAKDFGVERHVIITTNNFSSEALAYLYNGCNCTFLPSLGEGFGYPIVESLACGVPVVHCRYGGGMELVPLADWLVESTATRLDTQWNCVRPVLSPDVWAEKLQWAVTQHGDGSFRDICVRSIEHLYWRNLWPSVWRKWFLDGLRSGQPG